MMPPELFQETSKLGASLLEHATRFANAARKMLTFTILLSAVAGISWGIGALSFRSINPTIFWILGIINLIPVLACSFFGLIFYFTTQLPWFIKSNMQMILGMLQNDIPDTVSLIKDEKWKGSWRILVNGAKILKKLYFFNNDLQKGNPVIGSTIAMATPLFWIAYAASIAGCVFMTIIVLISSLVKMAI